MLAWIVALSVLCGASNVFALIVESGTLRGLVEDHCPTCAYDNWTSHVVEGIVGSGYNNYGPAWFDPQMNGFGHFNMIPSDASGDATLAQWRTVFTAAVNGQWNSVDSILAIEDPVWHYELVELQDNELNRTYYILRERLDSSFVDHNVDSISTDDVVGSFRNGWGLFVFNPTAQFAKLNIEMPHPEDDFISIPVGVELFIRTDARAMMIAGAGREVLWDTTYAEYNNNRSLSDPSRNCRLPFAVCHQVLYDLLNTNSLSPLVTVQQHSYDHASHLNIPDMQLSAFADDSRPNPPLRDRAQHLDLIHFMGEFPVQGLPGYPTISARIDQYTGLWSGPAYAFYGQADTIAIPSSNDLIGAPNNCQGTYNHTAHNQYVDPENFIHCELDEYPDELWNPVRWDLWLPGDMPATLETYSLVLAYYEPYIAGLDSALRSTYLLPDTVAPVGVQLTQVVPVTADSMHLHWSPQATDRFFDTYRIYYDTTEVTDSSQFVERRTTGYSSLWDYTLTSMTVRIPAPPIDRYRFAIQGRDVWGNTAVRSLSVGMTPGDYVLTSAEQFSDTVGGGNGNGLAEFGETIGITLSEQNVGNQDAHGVTVRISTSDSNLRMIDSTEYYGTIPARQSLTVLNGFRALVSPDVADSHLITVTITTTDSLMNQWFHSFTILAHAGKPAIEDVVVNDSSGNVNGLMDPGESVGLTMTLRNNGSVRMDSLAALVTSDYANITLTQPTGTLLSLLPGQTANLTALSVQVLPSAPLEGRVAFYSALSAAKGRMDHLLFELPIGSCFTDLIEGGAFGWAHQPNQAGWTDQWHVSTTDYHSPTHSWKCGDAGTGNYANHMDAVALTPTVHLTGHQELRFWHRMQAEVSTSTPDSAYDGGIIQISVAGGAWQQLTPSGGYHKWTRCTAGGGNPYTGPFSCRTPCFSGSIPWSEVVCDLGAYTGDVQFRFRFGSDNSGTRIGWYVDNVRVVKANDNHAPRNLQAAVRGSAANLAWESPSTTTLAGSLRGYNIYRDSVRVDSLIQALSYQDDLHTVPFGDHVYAVTAQYSDTQSVFSNSATVTWDSIPAPVTNLTIRSSGQDIILRWTPTDASYYLVLSSSSATDFSGAIVTQVAAPPYVITGELAQFTKRYYLVLAVRE